MTGCDLQAASSRSPSSPKYWARIGRAEGCFWSTCRMRCRRRYTAVAASWS